MSARSARERAEIRTRQRRSYRYARYLRRRTQIRRAGRPAAAMLMALGTLFVMVVLALSVVAASVAAAAAYYVAQESAIQDMPRTIANGNSVRIYDGQGSLLYQLNRDGAQHTIALANIPVDVVNSTVAIEDHDFWNNSGVDFTSIARAAEQDLAAHRITQGGSTITQQLIKSQILGSEVTFQRKLDEAILAVGITETGAYSKRQILEMYLNSIPYSPIAYGIDAAAQQYFGYTDNPVTGETAAQHLDLARHPCWRAFPRTPIRTIRSSIP